jgi:type I restriction enzyme M protein
MSQRITQQQLESYLWGAATLLRGTIDAGDYKQFIFPLLFYKRLCDVFDEETQAALKESGGDKDFAAYPENHRFQIPSEAHWRNVRQAAKNVGKALQSAMRTIETANPDKLYGIFGDAQWTNEDRLSDAMLRDLVEHFSTLELAVANLPEDELGQGYEYLIKKFADDAGHTAAEFYTNRTVVHLMTEMLKPQPSESIYDPTCGSGGMLLSCITHLRRQGLEWRNVRLYGQERNLMTSSIARMNCFLHGIEDFQIVRGDTLSEPRFVQRDRLMRFDVVLANPPYSIKQWDRDSFASDPWGRNLFGTPPQGRADYAFWQHILCSLATKTGRCAILFPHGVLFRQEETEMRRKLIETDMVECVLGLGPNLFYNSPMEACVVICRSAKPKARKGRIIFINAVSEVTRERAQSFLTDEHIEHIVKAFDRFKDEPGFARVVTLEEIRKQGGNLNIALYVAAIESASAKQVATNGNAMGESLSACLNSAIEVRNAVQGVLGEKLVPCKFQDVTTIGKTLPSWLKLADWKRLAFGAFACSINERVEPVDAAEEIYVGLDDLDSKDLHIRRWGKGSDVIGTKLRFRKGDIIFGRRRAYQRKLAVAEMDGICSAHAMVVRAKPSMVLPEFLPFLMMSDRFMNRAVEISVGSLSPTINWTTLKLEEFDVPPLVQQRRIADILWEVDAAIERYSDFAAAAKEAGSWFRHEHFTNGDRYVLTPLRQAGRWISGGTPSRNRAEFWNGSFPWVSPKDMKQPVINDSEEHLSAAGRQESTEVGPGTLLIVIRGMILAHSFPVAIAQRNVAFNQDMKALVPSEAFSSKYLLHWFKWATPKVLGRISDSSHGTKRLAMEDLFDMKVPTPKLGDQSTFVEQIEKLESAETFAHKNIEALRLFSKTFLDRVVT